MLKHKTNQKELSWSGLKLAHLSKQTFDNGITCLASLHRCWLEHGKVKYESNQVLVGRLMSDKYFFLPYVKV